MSKMNYKVVYPLTSGGGGGVNLRGNNALFPTVL